MHGHQVQAQTLTNSNQESLVVLSMLYRQLYSLLLT